MDIDEAAQLIKDEHPVVVDIRQEVDYEKGHIKGSRHLTEDTIDSFLKETDKSKKVLCFCYHGFSSQSIKDYLEENGFKDVHSVDGGFEEWKTKYEVVQ